MLSMKTIGFIALLQLSAISAFAESHFVNVGGKQIEIPVPVDAVMAKGLNARFDSFLESANTPNARRLIYFVDPEFASGIRRGDFSGIAKLFYMVGCTPAVEDKDVNSSDFAKVQESIATKVPDLSNLLGSAISNFSAKMNEYWQKSGKALQLEISKPVPLGIFNKDSWSITVGMLTKVQYQDPNVKGTTQRVICEIASTVCARNRLLVLSCRSVFEGPETIGADLGHMLAWRDEVLEINPNIP
jgi:hypothetical protein